MFFPGFGNQPPPQPGGGASYGGGYGSGGGYQPQGYPGGWLQPPGGPQGFGQPGGVLSTPGVMMNAGGYSPGPGAGGGGMMLPQMMNAAAYPNSGPGLSGPQMPPGAPPFDPQGPRVVPMSGPQVGPQQPMPTVGQMDPRLAQAYAISSAPQQQQQAGQGDPRVAQMHAYAAANMPQWAQQAGLSPLQYAGHIMQNPASPGAQDFARGLLAHAQTLNGPPLQQQGGGMNKPLKPQPQLGGSPRPQVPASGMMTNAAGGRDQFRMPRAGGSPAPPPVQAGGLPRGVMFPPPGQPQPSNWGDNGSGNAGGGLPNDPRLRY